MCSSQSDEARVALVDLGRDDHLKRLGVFERFQVGAGQLVYDLVYHPTVTPFLAAATSGAAVRNGLGMLVYQAAFQFELFTGERAPIAEMWAAIATDDETS